VIVTVLANRKGGVAKSTTAVHVAHELARAGHSVALVDMDGQGTATKYVGLEAGGGDLLAALVGRLPLPLVDAPGPWGFRVAQGGPQMEKLTRELSHQRSPIVALTKLLQNHPPDADHLVIDTAASTGLPVDTALLAADYLVVPVETREPSLDGLDQLLDVLEGIESDMDRAPVLAGIVPTRAKRDSMTKEVLAHLDVDFSGLVAPAVYERVAVSESYSSHLPVTEHEPGGKAAKEMRACCQWIIERIT